MNSCPTSVSSSRNNSVDLSLTNQQTSCRKISFYNLKPKLIPRTSRMDSDRSPSTKLSLKSNLTLSTANRGTSRLSFGVAPPNFSYLKPHEGDTGPTAHKKYILSPNLATTSLFSRAVVMSGALGTNNLKLDPKEGEKRHIQCSLQEQQRDMRCSRFSDYCSSLSASQNNDFPARIPYMTKEEFKKLMFSNSKQALSCKPILRKAKINQMRKTRININKEPSVNSKKVSFDVSKTVFTFIKN